MTGNCFKMIQVISKVKIVIDEKTCLFGVIIYVQVKNLQFSVMSGQVFLG